MYPDFIFFERVGNNILPAIVDPHSIHLADTLPKMKGIIQYVQEFGESFSRYWFISSFNGQATYLDMMDPTTQDMISSATDANACFAQCGKRYMDGPLS